MRHEPDNVVAGLGLDLTAQRLLLRVGGAGEEEVLPDHEAQFVAGVVEGVVLVDAAAPDPYQVHARVGRLAQPGAVALRGDPGREDVVGDPVHAACEDAFAVDDEGESGAVRVRRAVHFHGPEADPPVPGVEGALFATGTGGFFDEREFQVVQGLAAVAAGPPQVGVGHLKCQHHVRPLHRAARLGESASDGGAHGERAGRPLRGPLDLHPQLDAAGAAVDRHQRAYAGQPGRRPPLQPDRAPDTGGHQGRTPVPAEAARHLADVLEGFRVDVGALPGQCPHRGRLVVRGGEVHLQQPVAPGDVEAVAPVHVPGAAQFPSVQGDGRGGVQAVEDQVRPLVLGRGGGGIGAGGRQVADVGPGPLSDPGHVGLVDAEEGVRDQAGREQIGVDAAGDLGGQQVIAVAEAPALGERDDFLHVRLLRRDGPGVVGNAPQPNAREVNRSSPDRSTRAPTPNPPRHGSTKPPALPEVTIGYRERCTSFTG